MRPVSLIIIALALVLAGLVFFVVPQLMPKTAPVVVAPPPQHLASGAVLVAARNLPAGLILKGDDVRWQVWPDDGLDVNFLVRERGATAQADTTGRVVLRGVQAGEPITAQRLLKPGDSGFLAAALTPGMHAVSVHVDAVSSTAGFIAPGDRVDVLLDEKFPLEHQAAAPASSGAAPTTSARPSFKQVNSIVLRDVRVLAIDQEVRDLDTKPKLGSTATVEVDLVQAQKLALAADMGGLSLALRSLTRPDAPEVRGGVIQDTDVSPFLSSIAKPKDAEPRVRIHRGVSGS